MCEWHYNNEDRLCTSFHESFMEQIQKCPAVVVLTLNPDVLKF